MIWLLGIPGFLLIVGGCAVVHGERDSDRLAGVRFERIQAAKSVTELDQWLAANQSLAQRLARSSGAFSGYGCISLNASNNKPEGESELESDSDPDADAIELEEDVDLDCVVVTGSRIMPEDIITNVQTSGIDEGGLLKRRGDHLLVLRGDEIFRIRIDSRDGPTLELEQSVSLTESAKGQEVWYDELLVFEQGAAVLSFDFGRSVTGLQLYRMGSGGNLTAAAHIEIQSEDYYSGSNYGLRLIGDRALFQVSVGLSPGASWEWPLWRSLDIRSEELTPDEWQPLIDVGDVLLPLVPISDPVIHATLLCEVEAMLAGSLDCAATGLIAEYWSELYVSRTAAYVAMDTWKDEAYLVEGASPWSWRARTDPKLQGMSETLIYRLPLDDSESVGAVFISGERGNQFSFREIGDGLVTVTELLPDPDARLLGVHQIPLDQFSGEASEARNPRIQTATLDVSHNHRTIRVADHHVLIGEHSLMVNDPTVPMEQTEFVVLSLLESVPERVILDQSVDRIEVLDGQIFVSGRGVAGKWSMSVLDPRSPDRVST
ncbi:MAG: hypothetical protein CVT76_07145, partial [Alphaproteobacteria bacterium HGW-Alphaproteobacteria-15]